MTVRPRTDIGAHVAVKTGVVPFADTGTAVNGPSVDRTTIDMPLSCVLELTTGVATGSPSAQTMDAKLQDSADNSAWADYVPNSGTAAVTQVTADSTRASKDISLKEARRYIRSVVTGVLTAGSSPTWPRSADIIFGGSDVLPAT